MLDVCDDSDSRAEHLESLYITYDGLLEPLGRSQIVPYVCALAASGVSMRVLSFEKPRDLADYAKTSELRAHLEEHSIVWPPPFSTSWREPQPPSAWLANGALRSCTRGAICRVSWRGA